MAVDCAIAQAMAMVTYHQPNTLEAMLAVLAAEPRPTIVAGATDIYPARTAGRVWGGGELGCILDISGVERLRGIRDEADHWVIGAATTWSDIADAATLPPAFDGLKAAAREIGGIQVQNRGTIGGNICTASPAGDSIPCLLTLDAEVVVARAGNGGPPETAVLPLSDFITGYRRTALKAGEVVVELRFAKMSNRARGGFAKLGARRYLVISIVMAAAVIEIDAAGIVTRARVAVGACSPVAQRLPALEADLIGHEIDPGRVAARHFAGLDPIDDVRASAAYRRAAAIQVVRDVVARSADAARAEAQTDALARAAS